MRSDGARRRGAGLIFPGRPANRYEGDDLHPDPGTPRPFPIPGQLREQLHGLLVVLRGLPGETENEPEPDSGPLPAERELDGLLKGRPRERTPPAGPEFLGTGDGGEHEVPEMGLLKLPGRRRAEPGRIHLRHADVDTGGGEAQVERFQGASQIGMAAGLAAPQFAG